MRYRDGRGDLAGLVSDVESLTTSLSEVADGEWIEDLRSAWWELELLLATSLDEERPLTSPELHALNDALAAIELLLQQQLRPPDRSSSIPRRR